MMTDVLDYVELLDSCGVYVAWQKTTAGFIHKALHESSKESSAPVLADAVPRLIKSCRMQQVSLGSYRPSLGTAFLRTTF